MDGPAPSAPPRRRIGAAIGGTLSWLVLGLLALALLLVVAVRWLDSDSGRAFIIRQLPLIKPQSGLVVRAERIDGSIYGKAVIHGLTVADPRGVFLTVPRLALDWRPLDLTRKRFTARDISAGEVRLLRLPRLNESEDDRILPDFDFDIARLYIGRLVLDPPVSGQRRVLSVSGRALIESGRARARLAAMTLGGRPGVPGDALVLALDAEPDRDIFDIDARVTAPTGGAIGGALGLKAPLTVTLAGDGKWRTWRGALTGRLGSAALADIAIANQAGLFTARGVARPGLMIAGAGARLTGPQLAIDGRADTRGDLTLLTLTARSNALVLALTGKADLTDETIDSGRLTLTLLQPQAVHPRITGRDVRLVADLSGRFAQPVADWRLTAGRAAWGDLALEAVAASGRAELGRVPLLLPVRATARQLAGVNSAVAPLVQQVNAAATLRWQGGQLTSEDLAVRTSRISARGALRVTPANGDFLITANAALPGYAIPATGLADITTTLRILPAAGGARITGNADVRLKRWDNGFFAALAEGPARVTGPFDIGPDLVVRFTEARLAAPGLTLAATGRWLPSGTIALTGRGTSRAWGPLTLAVNGPLTAPNVDAVLARPGVGIALADVRGRVVPAPGGWQFNATGGSTYGPVTARGRILTAREPVTIALDMATIAGVEGRGMLAQTAAGPFAGSIDFAGHGVTGKALLDAAGAVQRASITASARNADLPLEPPTHIDSLDLNAVVLLPDSGPDVDGTVRLSGLTRGGLLIDKADGKLAWDAGRGTFTINAAGAAGLPFGITASGRIDNDSASVTASGTLDRQPIRLSGPIELSRVDGDWVLAPVRVVTTSGSAELSGRWGATRRLKATLDHVGLGLATLFVPSVELQGQLTGTIDMALNPGDVPVGTAQLKVNGLSRAGALTSSTPIDLGINAALSQTASIVRAAIVRGGRIEGRAQARVGPIPQGAEPLVQRFFASPVSAQLRYNGPAQALWGLSGLEVMNVAGPVAVAADVRGILGDPQIAGVIRARQARVETPLLGAVVDDASLDARFNASRLELTSFAGKAGRDGSVSGSGSIDLSFERAFPMDIRINLKNAAVLARDDVSATASGNVRIATDEFGGVFSGKVNLERATYVVGRTAVAEVPVLQVTEKNAEVLGRRVARYVPPTRWLLNVEVKGDRRLFVEGMGIQSEWQADLKVRGPVTAPEVRGRVQLVRGDYDFAGKRFQLTRGDIRFQGVYPPDPVLNVEAESTANGFTAQLDITGTAQKPNIRFSSVPALPEDEVLSRVLFGSSVTDLSAPEAVQLAGALASLRGGSGGFNPIGMVRKGLGIDRLRVLPADRARGRGTSVAAGQYIGRSVYVELATDAQGYTATRFEIGLTRSLSVLSEVATLGGTGASVRWKRDY